MIAQAAFWIGITIVVAVVIVFYIGWRAGFRDGVSERTGSSRE
jgi:hypothetical protein